MLVFEGLEFSSGTVGFPFLLLLFAILLTKIYNTLHYLHYSHYLQQMYYITFSFRFTHTEREKNEKEKNEKEEKETTYYICTLGTPRYHI